MIANRISYFFDLRGPSFSVDTACSSSLVALHLAAQSIRNGEISTAIVGGTSANLVPEMFMAFAKLRIRSFLVVIIFLFATQLLFSLQQENNI